MQEVFHKGTMKLLKVLGERRPSDILTKLIKTHIPHKQLHRFKMMATRDDIFTVFLGPQDIQGVRFSRTSGR